MTMLRREEVKAAIVAALNTCVMAHYDRERILSAIDALPAAEPERAEGGERDERWERLRAYIEEKRDCMNAFCPHTIVADAYDEMAQKMVEFDTDIAALRRKG